jgi:hypothetical protein
VGGCDRHGRLLSGDRRHLSVAAGYGAQGQTGPQLAALGRTAAVAAGCGAAYLEIRAQAGLAQVLAERGDDAASGQARRRIDELYERAAVPGQDRIGWSPTLTR